jgi:hypothetical protein
VCRKESIVVFAFGELGIPVGSTDLHPQMIGCRSERRAFETGNNAKRGIAKAIPRRQKKRRHLLAAPFLFATPPPGLEPGTQWLTG